jgi:hypothetical protein
MATFSGLSGARRQGKGIPRSQDGVNGRATVRARIFVAGGDGIRVVGRMRSRRRSQAPTDSGGHAQGQDLRGRLDDSGSERCYEVDHPQGAVETLADFAAAGSPAGAE